MSIPAQQSLFTLLGKFSFRRLRKNYGNLKQKFGTLQVLMLLIIFPDGKRIVDRVEKHVLDAETDEVIVLRKLTSENCTMLAVAVYPVHLIKAEDPSKKFYRQLSWRKLLLQP
jgi:hypothetical protein